MPHLHAVSPVAQTATDSRRDQAISSATTLVTNLLRCMLFLIRHGIYVVGFEGRRHLGIDIACVKVAPSPYLHTLFSQGIWVEQRPEGSLVVQRWSAMLFGIRVEWEASCA